MTERIKWLAAISVAVTLVAFVVCVDITAIPGVAHDNPQLAAKIAAYLVVGFCNVILVGVAAVALAFGGECSEWAERQPEP